MEKVSSGDHALICVTELMQHTIDLGNQLFADTPYADTWMINSDRLAAWWEAEAQDYLDERGFKDRQVRAWGDTNSEFWRYHESVVGDRPELCALDFHLFEDHDWSSWRHSTVGASAWWSASSQPSVHCCALTRR